MRDPYENLTEVLLNLSIETREQLELLFPPSATWNDNRKPPESVDVDKLRAELAMHDSIDSVWMTWNELLLDDINRDAAKKRRDHEAELKKYDDAIKLLKKEERLAVDLSTRIEVRKNICDIEARRNTAWEKYDEVLREIERRKHDCYISRIEQIINETLEEKISSIIAERRRK